MVRDDAVLSRPHGSLLTRGMSADNREILGRALLYPVTVATLEVLSDKRLFAVEGVVGVSAPSAG